MSHFHDDAGNSLRGEIDFRGCRNEARRGITVYIGASVPGRPGEHYEGKVIFEPSPPSYEAYERRACFCLDDEEAQQLMDMLYRAGIRPTDARGSAGQLLATQAHLDDMRAMTTRMLDALLAKNPPNTAP